MEVRKICHFLIVIFLCLAILFFVLYTNEYQKKQLLDDEFVDSAVANLASQNITIDADIIDKHIPDKDIYVFSVDNEEESNNLIIQAIKKGVFNGKTVETMRFETPEGVSFGFFDKRDASVELGRVVFSLSDLSFTYSKTGFDVVGINEAIFNSDTQLDSFVKDCVDTVCTNLITSDNLGFRITGSTWDEQYRIVTVIETVDAHDIDQLFLNFVFKNNEVVFVSGHWVTQEPKAKYHNVLVDGVNVLYNLDLKDISSITNQRIVYLHRKSNSGIHYLVPGWEITYTHKNGKTQKAYFDAL